MMIPFTPHLAHECLELLNCKTIAEWPKIVSKDNALEKIKMAVQINGKTRDILTVQRDLAEDEINKIIRVDSKAKKYLEDKKTLKIIFVKNKIINYILLNK